MLRWCVIRRLTVIPYSYNWGMWDRVAAAIDEVGAATPEAARVRWAAQFSLEVDVEQPDRVNGSGDRITARYLLDRPDLDPSRTAFQEIVTERGDDGGG